MELPVGDVEGDHGLGAALEEAVREAARGGTQVEAAAAGRIDPEGVEGIGQLGAATRDERRPLGHGQVHVVGYELARLLGTEAVPAKADVSRQHGGSSPGARLVQAALGEQGVQAALCHRRSVSASAARAGDASVIDITQPRRQPLSLNCTAVQQPPRDFP